MIYGWLANDVYYCRKGRPPYPDLSLGQIYAALAYYADHQAELDRAIEADEAEYERLRAAAENSPLRQTLRARGLII